MLRALRCAVAVLTVGHVTAQSCDLPQDRPLRILCLGDSITEDFADTPTYRSFFHRAIAGDWDVDFVGRQHGVFPGLSPRRSNFDQDHEGYATASIADWIDQPRNIPPYTAGFAIARAQPDVVAIDLGINDLKVSLLSPSLGPFGSPPVAIATDPTSAADAAVLASQVNFANVHVSLYALLSEIQTNRRPITPTEPLHIFLAEIAAHRCDCRNRTYAGSTRSWIEEFNARLQDLLSPQPIDPFTGATLRPVHDPRRGCYIHIVRPGLVDTDFLDQTPCAASPNCNNANAPCATYVGMHCDTRNNRVHLNESGQSKLGYSFASAVRREVMRHCTPPVPGPMVRLGYVDPSSALPVLEPSCSQTCCTGTRGAACAACGLSLQVGTGAPWSSYPLRRASDFPALVPLHLNWLPGCWDERSGGCSPIPSMIYLGFLGLPTASTPAPIPGYLESGCGYFLASLPLGERLSPPILGTGPNDKKAIVRWDVPVPPIPLTYAVQVAALDTASPAVVTPDIFLSNPVQLTFR